jgi:hypothetical protein
MCHCLEQERKTNRVIIETHSEFIVLIMIGSGTNLFKILIKTVIQIKFNNLKFDKEKPRSGNLSFVLL